MATQYTSYYLYEKYEKRGDQEAIPVYPNVYSVDADGTMPKVIKIENDIACGYVPTGTTQYRWVNLDPSVDYDCDECGGQGGVTFKWEVGSNYVCEGTTKYEALYLYLNSGNGWEIVNPSVIKPGSILEEKSTDCGYVYPRMIATMSDDTVKEVDYCCTQGCDTCHINDTKIINANIPISQIKHAEFYHGALIYGYSFNGFQTLSSVTFVNGEEIGNCTFFSTGLRSVSGNISSMGDYSFMNCKSLTSFTETSQYYHNGINGIGALANCTGLTNVDLSKLGGYGNSSYDGGGGWVTTFLFGNCTNLRTAKIAISAPYSNVGTTYRNEISTACFENCINLTDVEVFCGIENNAGVKCFNNVASIGGRAFFNCKSLSSITLSVHDKTALPPDATPFGVSGADNPLININGIGRFTFYNCEKLPITQIERYLFVPNGTSYSFPDGVFANCKLFTHLPEPQNSSYLKSIGDYAFSGCTGLQSLSFTSGLTSIGAHAFEGCSGLTAVTVDVEYVRIDDYSASPSLGDNAFDNTSANLVIYVPATSVEAYKNGIGWSAYADRIQAII